MDVLIMLLEIIGTIIMGFIVMWIGFYFIARETTFNAAEFGGFLSAFFGGAVLQIYTTQLSDETKFIFWFYPVGLGAALIVYHFWGWNPQKLRFEKTS